MYSDPGPFFALNPTPYPAPLPTLPLQTPSPNPCLPYPPSLPPLHHLPSHASAHVEDCIWRRGQEAGSAPRSRRKRPSYRRAAAQPPYSPPPNQLIIANDCSKAHILHFTSFQFMIKIIFSNHFASFVVSPLSKALIWNFISCQFNKNRLFFARFCVRELLHYIITILKLIIKIIIIIITL